MNDTPQHPFQSFLDDFAVDYYEKKFEQLKQRGLAQLTPESIRNKLFNMNISNSDADPKRLSKDEAARFIGEMFRNPQIGSPESSTIPERKEMLSQSCEIAGSKKDEFGILYNMLSAKGHFAFIDLQTSRGFAQAIELDDKDTEKAIQAYAGIIASKSRITPDDSANMSSATLQAVNKKLQAVVQELVERKVDIIRQNPDIRAALIDMPDITELGKLNSDDVCKAITGKATGKSI